MLYENWLSADENWSKSKLVLSLQQSSKLSTFGCRKWFTRQDLIDKYKSPEIASEIIQEKLALEESVRNTVVRPHPDAPSNLLLQQFLCFDEDGESEQHDSVLSSLFQAVSKNKKKDKDKKNGNVALLPVRSRQSRGLVRGLVNLAVVMTRRKRRMRRRTSQVRRRERILRRTRKTKKKPRSRKKLARKKN